MGCLIVKKPSQKQRRAVEMVAGVRDGREVVRMDGVVLFGSENSKTKISNKFSKSQTKVFLWPCPVYWTESNQAATELLN